MSQPGAPAGPRSFTARCREAERSGIPVLMGILNLTPDSFSDGGAYTQLDRAVQRARELAEAGAEVIDIGGESTRPGAQPVAADAELRRVLPVIEILADELPGVILSIDTRKASVARGAIEAGVRVVNDVSALDDPEMAQLVSERQTDIVLMHMRGHPSTMQNHTSYDDLVGEVERALLERVRRAEEAGISRERIVLDPGVGFGKSPGDNPRLIAATSRLAAHGMPVLIGASRKRFIGEISGVRRASDRVAGSVGAALAAAHCGAAALRVHDVAFTRQALAVYRAIAREC